MKTLAVVVICLAFPCGSALAQDAKAVIASAQKALGDVKSITYSGSAKDVAFQQCGANAADMNCRGTHDPMRPINNYVRVIDLTALTALCGFRTIADFQQRHREWVEAANGTTASNRDDRWSESLAVGSKRFVDQVKAELGIQAKHRQVAADKETHTLKESTKAYTDHFDSENGALRGNNAIVWQTIP